MSRLEIGFIVVAVALLTVVITRGNPKPLENDAFVMAGSNLAKPGDINAFVKFPEGTKSLLSQFLTPEIYEAYKGQKDATGFSFEQVIFSGVKNTDSGVGVYAGSHDSYYTFSDLFDKVIEAYHGHKKGE